MSTKPWLDYINWQNDFSVVPYYVSLIDKIKKRGYEIMDNMQVEFTDQDPYSTSIEMRKDLRKWIIKVFTWGEDHPVFTREDNNLFRLVHDVDWHWLDLSFSLDDEIKTYDRMVEKLDLDEFESKALYTEIVWQVTAYYITKNFQEQKVLFIS